jgi:oligopeptide transport system substrate-binding protein
MRRALAAFLAVALLLIGTSVVNAAMVLNRGNGAEPKSMDPHYIDGVWEMNIVGDLLIGLFTDGPDGRAIPGAADRWTISGDGKTWTFHIRDHVWSDGTPVTAHDFVFAWQRLLDPKLAAPYAYNLWIVKNGRAISDGRMMPAALGVRAKDDRTLVVELEHPAAYLPELLTHPVAYPLPRAVVQAKGAAWARPANFAGNGPYMLREWLPNDHITLVKHPRFYDAAGVRIDRVNYYPTIDGNAAIKMMRAGQLDTQNPFPANQINWIRANMPGALRMVPYLAINYATFNLRHPPFDDIRVREAINLAYDRETMTDKVLRLGEPPAYSIVPPGIANYPVRVEMGMKAMTYAQRLRLAQHRMREAGYGPNNRLRFTYHTTTSPDPLRTAAVLQHMLRAIYIDMDIEQSDIQVHYKKLQTGNFDVAYSGWVADFNDASNFLDLLRGPNGTNWGNNFGYYHNPKFDALLNQANEQPNAQMRARLLLQAERIALSDYAWLPERFPFTLDLVQPYVRGWIANVRALNRTRWLWIDRAAARTALRR